MITHSRVDSLFKTNFMSRKKLVLFCSIATMVLSLGLLSFFFFKKIEDTSQIFMVFTFSMMGMIASAMYYGIYREIVEKEKEEAQ